MSKRFKQEAPAKMINLRDNSKFLQLKKLNLIQLRNNLLSISNLLVSQMILRI